MSDVKANKIFIFLSLVPLSNVCLMGKLKHICLESVSLNAVFDQDQYEVRKKLSACQVSASGIQTFIEY